MVPTRTVRESCATGAAVAGSRDTTPRCGGRSSALVTGAPRHCASRATAMVLTVPRHGTSFADPNADGHGKGAGGRYGAPPCAPRPGVTRARRWAPPRSIRRHGAPSGGRRRAPPSGPRRRRRWPAPGPVEWHAPDPVAEGGRQAGVGPVLDTEGDHLLVGGRDRPCGQGRGGLDAQLVGTARVRTPAASATLTVSPTPSIHAVPADPVTRVSTRMPRSDAVLCSMPTHPLCHPEVHDEAVVGGHGPVDDMGQRGAHPGEVPQGRPDLVDELRAVGPEPPTACRRVGPPRRHHGVGVDEHGDVHEPGGDAGSARRGRSGTRLGQQRLPGVVAELGPQEMHDPGLCGRDQRRARASAVSAGEGLLAQDVSPRRNGLEGRARRGCGAAWRW